MKKLYFSLFVVSSILISTELIGRYLGLHQVPLFEENKYYEYIHKPNQNTLIYRNKFITNEFSMRSAPISVNDTLVVLLIGDSILNGTNQVDNDDLASTLLENKLKKTYNRSIRVLNISSFTWGPDNVYAYLQQHGLFSADLIVMINNSGDAYDNMTFTKIVGIHEKMPAENYQLASICLAKKIYTTIKWFVLTGNTKKKQSQKFNSGFGAICDLATNAHIPLLVYLHSSRTELKTHRYYSDGEKILAYFKDRHVNVIKELDYPVRQNLFLDEVHFNKEGQYFMSQLLYPAIYCQLMSHKKTAVLKNV